MRKLTCSPGVQKKGEQFRVELAHLMPLAVVLRSGVAPQRCSLSYTGAKVVKVFVTTKTFADYFVKMQKVSHEVGHFKPKCNLKSKRLLPKHFIRTGDIISV